MYRYITVGVPQYRTNAGGTKAQLWSNCEPLKDLQWVSFLGCLAKQIARYGVSDGILCYAPAILSRFGRYVVPTLLTPTFRRNLCWFRLGATLCDEVLLCCHAIATPEPRHCPVLIRLTSGSGKFSCVVLRYVSLPPRCCLAVATLSYAVPRIWQSIACHNVSET